MTTAARDQAIRPDAQLSNRNGESVRLRVQQLLECEIEFVPNAQFRVDREGDNEIVEAVLRAARETGEAPADLPAHLRRMSDADLLTHEQEAALFREMNFLKFKADAFRTRLSADRSDQRTLAVVEALLTKAATIRDHLVKANMRLVMSIVKKFVTPQHSFDDMLSDGIFTLLQTVEKFDYDRGFRFSTYAYRSIARNAYRSVTTAQKEEARLTRDADEWAFAQEDDRSSLMSDLVWANLLELTAAMLNKLDRRERLIIRSRYALGAHRNVRTFQYLADKLGVSKERVRQLEQRAVGKLRVLAAEHKRDELFAAALV